MKTKLHLLPFTVFLLIIGFLTYMQYTLEEHTPEPVKMVVPEKEDSTIEVSRGGYVQRFNYRQGATVHVIVDDEDKLVDIQIFEKEANGE